ncbi:MAG: hypothetical protein GX862_04375 [Leucobacter sp.]|nr:hypothetical protein [Leucobacter sp.]
MHTLASVFGAVAHAVFACVSISLVFTDVREHRLPNRVLGYGGALTFVLLASSALASAQWPRLWLAGMSAAVYAVCACVLWMATPGAIGAGDMNLAPIIGLVVGWWGTATAFIMTPLLLGLIGVVVGGVALARRRRQVAFGPVMLAACWAAVAAEAVRFSLH